MDELRIDEFSRELIRAKILWSRNHAVILAGPERQLKRELSQGIAAVLGVELSEFECPGCTPFHDSLPLESLLETQSYPFLFIDRVELAGFNSLRWLRNVLEYNWIKDPEPRLSDCIFVLSTEEYSDIFASPEAVSRILYDEVLPNRPNLPKHRWPKSVGPEERVDVFKRLWWEKMDRQSTVIDIAGVTLLGRSSNGEAGDILPSSRSDNWMPVKRPLAQPLPAEPTDTYDVFVSYKTARHSGDAEKLVAMLRRRGLRVWFDVDQLNKKERQHFKKAELIKALTSAVKSARLSVVFEAQLEAVALRSGQSREEALKSQECMLERGSLVAWNWQKLEIDASEAFIAIHPNFLVTRDGSKHHFRDKRMKLFEVMDHVLAALPDQRESRIADGPLREFLLRGGVSPSSRRLIAILASLALLAIVVLISWRLLR